MSETLAIIGRPNVGKSTLFNRLIGRRLALVANEPGITRDYRVEKLNIKNHSYELIDTAGIEELSKDNISKITKDSSISAIKKSDIILFVIDSRNNNDGKYRSTNNNKGLNEKQACPGEGLNEE